MSTFEQRKKAFERVLAGSWASDPDWDKVSKGWTDDIELDYSNSIGPLKGIYRGHEGLREFRDAFSSAFSELKVELEELIDPGPDSLVAATNVQVVGEGSGAAVTGRGGMLVEFRGERVCRMKLFQSLDDALAEAKGTD